MCSISDTPACVLPEPELPDTVPGKVVAPPPPSGNGMPPPVQNPGDPQITITITITLSGNGPNKNQNPANQPGETDVVPVDPDLQSADPATDKLNKNNAYVDPKTKEVYEKNGCTGKFAMVGYVGDDGKFHRNSGEQILKDNYGAAPIEQKDAPKGYKYDKAKAPMLDADGNVWEKDPSGEYRKVGYKDNKGDFRKYSEAQTIKQSFGGAPMTSANQPEGYKYDPNKYPLVDDDKNIWEWNKDTAKYEKVGGIGEDGKYKPDTAGDILNNNYGPTTDIDANNAPKGYKVDPDKDPKMDKDGNVWEWDAPKGKYEKIGYVDQDNNFHAPVTVKQPDPSTLKKAVGANYDNGGKIPDEAYIDPNGDVFAYKNDKYVQVGHVDGNNTYHHYSPDEIMRESYGAEEMSPDKVPEGYTYDQAKHPKIDDDGKVWEWDPAHKDYVNRGYIGTDGKYHKGQPPVSPG